MDTRQTTVDAVKEVEEPEEISAYDDTGRIQTRRGEENVDANEPMAVCTKKRS